MENTEDPKMLIEAIREATKELKAENDRKEALQAKDAFGGKSEAGTIAKEKTPEDLQREKINKILGGTGYSI